MSLGIIKSHYEDHLSSYAQKSAASKGRKYKELPHPFRNPYQRDRDRIVHCRAFRRLEYKTQVLVNYLGDHYRTRLTHSIEVSMISRCIARVLDLHEDFVEALSLAHDLGHPPFGHAGEKILNKLLMSEGGFDHNLQALRIVELLENPYPQFQGLNLTYELRKGLLKTRHKDVLEMLGDDKSMIHDDKAILEAQVVDLADEVTYTCHDLEDGLTHGYLYLKDVKKLSIWKFIDSPFNFQKNFPEDVMYYHLTRSLIDFLVRDLVETTAKNIKDANIKTIKDVTSHKHNISTFSRKVKNSFKEIQEVLLEKFYQHDSILSMTETADKVLTYLFHHYVKNSADLPDNTLKKTNIRSLKRVVCDYIAGMTDRYALDDYKHKRFK